MSVRVLAGPEAIAEANRMRSIIEGGLESQLSALNSAAERLSDRNVWDGPHAENFRGMWDQIEPRLRQAQADLLELRNWIHTVATQILAAGGSAA